jgi:NADPH-dependent ferric siderophore reductase
MKVPPIRRVPRAFETVTVAAVDRPSSGFVRVRLEGAVLSDRAELPLSSSIRVLVPSGVPSGPEAQLELPSWQGNEFLWADGTRPPIRTLTPLDLVVDLAQPERSSLTVMVLLHTRGHLCGWARSVRPGDVVAVSEIGRGYEPPSGTTEVLMFGDESALPAMAQLQASLTGVEVRAHLAFEHEDSPSLLRGCAEIPRQCRVRPCFPLFAPRRRAARATAALPAQPLSRAAAYRRSDRPSGPHEGLLAAVESIGAPQPGTAIWAAGEAATMQAIRVELASKGWAREQLWVRGYWKRSDSPPPS